MKGYKRISLSSDEENKIREYMPKFIFYRRNHRETDCYCTSCHSRYTDSLKSEYSHKAERTCIVCGDSAEARQMDRGRKTYHKSKNFVVIRAKSYDEAEILAVKVIQTFDDDCLEPALFAEIGTFYRLEPGSAKQYYFSGGQVREYRKTGEPTFFSAGYGYHDNRYIVINRQETEKTFLRYLFRNTPDEELPELYVSYLCRYVQHQNLEYLVKGGFRRVADMYVRKTLDVRINWKSNNLLEMLKINREERNFLADTSYYENYIKFRRSFGKEMKNTAETISFFEKFRGNYSLIKSFCTATGKSGRKIMKYLMKQKNSQGISFIVYIYRDYIMECETLKYDFSDESVTFPPSLIASHERTSRLCAEIQNKSLDSQIISHNSERSILIMEDENSGLFLKLPQSVADIVNEGKILSHCVGGYAERHAKGILTILFLRHKNDPETPFFTLEVSTDYNLIQCHGFKNELKNPKPDEVIEFEKKYRDFLHHLNTKKKSA